MTARQLQAIMPNAKRVEHWATVLGAAAAEFDINTVERLAAWLGQVAVESGELKATVENLNYSAERLPKVFKAYRGKKALAEAESGRPDVISNRVYAGRNGNGSIDSGDGWRYRGRGLLQVTGRANYKQMAEWIGLDLVEAPDMLEDPAPAARSAAAYFAHHGCNEMADEKRYEAITRAINGPAMLHHDKRVAYTKKALAELAGVESV